MPTWKKLYQRIQRNPKQTSFQEIDRLLKRAGFQRRQPRGGSNHYTYTKGPKRITIPKQKPVKPVYVRMALDLFKGELPDE